ncbi:MAG: xylulokinase [Hyphomicrobiales bacterium]
MFYIGLDIGSTTIKGSLYDAKTGEVVRRTKFPKEELCILSPEVGMAEQNPEEWWTNVKQVILGLVSKDNIGKHVRGIGIIYQMHGLICVDKNLQVLRPAIIWCDSRAVNIGDEIQYKLNENIISQHILNPPGNLTAAKLAWVKRNEPHIYDQIHKILLPGDYIAMKLSGTCETTISGLSEMALWDFKENCINEDVLKAFGFEKSILPKVVLNQEIQTIVNKEASLELGIKEGTPISYRAGDQVGNAFAVNVNKPGEAVCNAGTSGVIYGLSKQISGDSKGRYNSIAHSNYTTDNPLLGYLLCINGCGILYSWLKNNICNQKSFEELNMLAGEVSAEAEGLRIIPYGNGAERSLCNKMTGAHFMNIDFNRHSYKHIIRAALEGIAFSFKYGLEILQDNDIQFEQFNASFTNLMQSGVFTQTLSDITYLPITCLQTEGSDGAARGAAVGTGEFHTEEVFKTLRPHSIVKPKCNHQLKEAYLEWKEILNELIKRDNHVI